MHNWKDNVGNDGDVVMEGFSTMATQIIHPHFRLMGETIGVGGNVNVQNVPNNLSSALGALGNANM